MKKSLPLLLGSVAVALAMAQAAHAQTTPAPENVVQLTASGTVEVQQDLLVLTLSTTKEGKDATVVQNQLRQALDTALAQARRKAEPRQMEVRTGHFSLSPRYGQNSQITGWQGSAELVLEGRDFPRITSTAASVTTMTINRVAFDLSREQRESVERDAQQQAIARFKAQADQLAKGFGFASFTLREVSVQSDSSAPGPRPRMMAMEARSAGVADAIPVEAGKADVTVTVSGSVQMR